MNPYIIDVLLKEKRADMLKEAERQRLIAQYEAAQQPAENGLRVALGDSLIRLGEWLKRRSAGKLEQPAG